MAPANAPPVLTAVAQRFAQTTRGVVGFRLHRRLSVRAGFSSRREDLVLNGIYDDGAVVRVKVSTYTIDGRAADANAVSTIEHEWGNPKTGDVFAAPYDSRNFNVYQYRMMGNGSIAFTSSVRNMGHGNGTFTYDARSNVVGCVYQPNALPPHAQSGQFVDKRSEVLPGYWAVTQEVQTFKGTVGPFSASGTVEIDYTNFHRFRDLRSATRSLL